MIYADYGFFIFEGSGQGAGGCISSSTISASNLPAIQSALSLNFWLDVLKNYL